jgi:hypothetical protein
VSPSPTRQAGPRQRHRSAPPASLKAPGAALRESPTGILVTRAWHPSGDHPSRQVAAEPTLDPTAMSGRSSCNPGRDPSRSSSADRAAGQGPPVDGYSQSGEDGCDSPHPYAIHGSARPAKRPDSTALGRPSLIRPPWPGAATRDENRWARPSSAFLGAREPVDKTDAGAFPAPRTVAASTSFSVA